jgi:hypothetical protein
MLLCRAPSGFGYCLKSVCHAPLIFSAADCGRRVMLARMLAESLVTHGHRRSRALCVRWRERLCAGHFGGQDNSVEILLSIARDETVAAERRGSPLWLPCALQLSRGKEALDRIAMLDARSGNRRRRLFPI